MSKKLKLGNQYREFHVRKQDVNVDSRTIELAFSSETPVERWYGNEILDHSRSAVNLNRLNSGGALLVDHDTGDQVGVVEKARVDEDRVGRATVRFGKSARAEEIFQDVKDGIRSLVSVGYRVEKMVTDSVDGDVETLRATSWEPLEISIVSVPADASVGVGRSGDQNQTHEVEVENNMKRNFLMNQDSNGGGGGATATAPGAPAVAAPTINVVEERKRAVTEEQKRTSEILALGSKYKMHDEAAQFVAEGKRVDEFQGFILEKKCNATPIVADPNIGMSEKEKRNYSILRALLCLSMKKPVDGLEKEVSDAVCQRTGRQTDGFLIPHDIATHKRDMTAGVAANGGNTVQTDVLGQSLIELLRRKMVVARLGAQVMAGLQGNVAIPRQTGGATAYWLTETGGGTESDQTINQMLLVPHRLNAWTNISKTLMIQSTLDAEAFCRNDLMRVLAIAKDLAAISGTGADGQPTGILNTSGIGSVTFGAAATWAKVVSFESAVAAANADFGSLAYVASSSTRGKFKTVTKIASSQYSNFLWDTMTGGDQFGDGMVNGYRAAVTNQLDTATNGDKLIFGNFNDLILADWEGMDVTVDPYSKAENGLVRVIIQTLTDVGVRHAGSFAASTDSAIQ